MLGNEERARLDREVPKRNQMLRIEVQKKRRKRESLTLGGDESRRIDKKSEKKQSVVLNENQARTPKAKSITVLYITKFHRII